MVAAIRDMVIRGAPALGVAGGFGVALKITELAEANELNWQLKLQQAAMELIPPGRQR